MPAGSLPVKTAVLALCGALFLGACSSDAEGGGSSSTTPDAVETSAPVSSPSGTTALGSPGSSEPSGGGSGDASPSGGSGAPTSPQPSTPDGETPAPPVMPAAAKENTAEGAEAFARWYVESINHLFRYPQAGVIDEFSAPSCEQCQRIAETVEEFESKGQRADRLPLAMKDEARVTPSGRGKFLVGVQGSSDLRV
ncbi:hypothetical protein CYJ76_09475 [Kytococcus schroeteri]|uniref:DUF6318 domain-containing protein n=1 Tax=Kytococcus schroeteri TaxID=138300 RepID=A0A2I1P8V0_9MICO|nr:hypothetical protein CYJ76_09475 [Kytococcus schroeteri]